MEHFLTSTPLFWRRSLASKAATLTPCAYMRKPSNQHVRTASSKTKRSPMRSLLGFTPRAVSRPFAQAYIKNARYCYLRWGALGKVRQLDQGYPLHHEEQTPSSAATIETALEQLDLRTVMKVSQAVSGEIVLEQLVQTLMVIAVEHAGAERGLLILPYGEEHRIAAKARTGRDEIAVQLQEVPITSSDLPDSLLRYVIRTQESVILDDASAQNLFSEDEYFRQEQRPRSVLCLPLVKQAKLDGGALSRE